MGGLWEAMGGLHEGYGLRVRCAKTRGKAAYGLWVRCARASIDHHFHVIYGSLEEVAINFLRIIKHSIFDN